MPDSTILEVNLFDGNRQPVDPSIQPHVQVFDGDSPSKRIGDSYKKANSFLFPDLPYADNFADNFRVIATANHHFDAGFVPVKMSKNQKRTLNLMLLPKNYEFRFIGAAWEQLRTKRPELFDLLKGQGDEAAAQARYAALMNGNNPALAGLLNITTALSAINLPKNGGKTALSFYKEMIWDEAAKEAPQQDRFYAYATKDLIDEVVAAVHQGDFAPEHLAGLVHHGASRSYKELRFGEANVQITFHENIPGPEGLVKVETDIDYYKNAVAHAMLEVIPNHFTKGKTNPVQAYALRWTAAKEQNLPDFDPLFTIVNKA
jgi:hypothetical protein